MKNASVLVRSSSELTALKVVPMTAAFTDISHLFRLPTCAAPTAHPCCIGNWIGAWIGSVMLPMALFDSRFLVLRHGLDKRKEEQTVCLNWVHGKGCG
jgi:hypothetical protein